MLVVLLAIRASWISFENKGRMQVYKELTKEQNACPRIINWTGGQYPGWDWRQNECTGQFIDARYDGRLIYELARQDTICFDTIFYDKELTDIFNCFRRRGYN